MYNLIPNSTTNFDDFQLVKKIEFDYVSLSESDSQYENIKDGDKIVIDAKKIYIIYSYPLSNNFICEYQNDMGFTKFELIKLIMETYKQIYMEEEQTTQIPVVSIEERIKRGGLINRNGTNGKYSIWGHDLEDLNLWGISIYTQEGNYYLSLGVDS